MAQGQAVFLTPIFYVSWSGKLANIISQIFTYCIEYIMSYKKCSFFKICSKQLKNLMHSIIKVYVWNSNKLFSFAWIYFTSIREKVCIVNSIYLYWHQLSKETTKFIHVTQLIRCLLDNISETPLSGASLFIIMYYTSH